MTRAASWVARRVKFGNGRNLLNSNTLSTCGYRLKRIYLIFADFVK